MGKTQQQSLTLVPLSLYFKDGRAKVELALAKGRRHYDKRHAIAARDAEREAARAGKDDRSLGGRGAGRTPRSKRPPGGRTMVGTAQMRSVDNPDRG